MFLLSVNLDLAFTIAEESRYKPAVSYIKMMSMLVLLFNHLNVIFVLKATRMKRKMRNEIKSDGRTTLSFLCTYIKTLKSQYSMFIKLKKYTSLLKQTTILTNQENTISTIS